MSIIQISFTQIFALLIRNRVKNEERRIHFDLSTTDHHWNNYWPAPNLTNVIENPKAWGWKCSSCTHLIRMCRLWESPDLHRACLLATAARLQKTGCLLKAKLEPDKKLRELTVRKGPVGGKRRARGNVVGLSLGAGKVSFHGELNLLQFLFSILWIILWMRLNPLS